MFPLRREFTLVELIVIALVAALSAFAFVSVPTLERRSANGKPAAPQGGVGAIAREAQNPSPLAGGDMPGAVGGRGADDKPASATGRVAEPAAGPGQVRRAERILVHEVIPVLPGSAVGTDAPVMEAGVAPGDWTARAASLSAPAWSDIAAAGDEGSVEVAWQHQARFTSYTIQCTGGSPQSLVALLVDPASQFWANYGALYQSMGYDVVSFTPPADGTELSRLVRQPGPADALPFEHTCRVVGYPDVDTPGTYEASNQATATPAPGPGYVPPPAVPTGLSATVAGPTAVELAWDPLVSPPDVPFDGYRVYVDGSPVGEVLATEPSPTYTAGALTSGVEHSFGVSSFGSGGESELAPASATPTPVLVASGIHGPADGPRGMAFDASGNLYVAVPDAGTVVQVAPAGTVSTLTDAIDTPLYVAVDDTGDVYVADGSGAVSRVTPAGVVSGFASGFGEVRGLAFDPSGDLYVASASGTVSKVTPAGVVSLALTGFTDLQVMAADSAGAVYLANADGTVIELTGTPHTTVGWAAPRSMTFDPDGNLYLAEANDTVYQVSPDGNTVTAIAAGFTLGVRSVAFHSGFLYVADAGGTIVKIG